MGRKKKSLIEKSPFKLRHRKLADGRLSLFLDRSVNGGHEYEFLQLYLVPETSTQAKRQNARTLRKAEDILHERTEALIGAKVEAQPKKNGADILLSEWLQTSYDNHEKRGARDLGSIRSVKRALHMFRPVVRLSEIDKQFCLDLIDWLRNTYKHRRTGKPVSARTGDTYCQTFRTALNEAVREGLICKNPWNLLETVEKIKKLPVALTVQPGFSWLDKRYLKSYEQFLPKEKAEQQIPLKELTEAGVCICGSSDSPVQSMNPYEQMLGMVEFYLPGQSLTPFQALRTYTAEPARMLGEELESGTLEVGKKADFFVTGKDFCRAEPEKIGEFYAEYLGKDGRRYVEKKGTIRELVKLLLRRPKKI